MQINLSPSIPLIQRSPDNERATARAPRQGNETQRENNDSSKQAQQSHGGATITGTLLSATQRVSATERSDQSNFRNVNPFSDVLPENRRALESYINTANTPTESSAAELVGVDIFV